MISPPQNTDTAVIPAPRTDRLPRPGTYHSAADRCVLEISAGVGPVTTVRGRLAVATNTLTVDGGEESSSLRFEASSVSLRTNRPLVTRRLLGRRGLNARRHQAIRFESTAIGAVGLGDRCLSIPGKLYLRGTPIDVTLDARVISHDDDRLLIIATARLSYPALREACSVRLPWSVPANRIQILIAADFR
jgi:polyisoprenoid-binding protein YceI